MHIKKIIDSHIDNEIEIEYYNENISLKDIKAFEKEIGFSLPEDFIAFCTSDYVPISIHVKDEIWEDGSCGDRGPAWTFMNGLFYNSFSTSIHEDFHIPTLSKEFQELSEINAVVFMNHSSNQDPFCILENQKIYQFTQSGYELCEYEEGFLKFFEIELQDLMRRKEAYKKWKNDHTVSSPLSVRYD
jgi:hypothetical protein